MSKIAVVVTTSVIDNKTVTAIEYVTAALEQGEGVIGVFFYQDGVLNAGQNVSIPSDEFQSTKAWQVLHERFNLPLYLCISAAEKRGLSDQIPVTTDNGTTQMHSNMLPCFTISGLGELVELTTKADKVVQL